jgi:hypothetical protein
MAGLCGNPGGHHVLDLLCRSRTGERRVQTTMTLLGHRAWSSYVRLVFLLLWPEYASDKVIERLAGLVHSTLKFAKEVSDRSIPDGRIAAKPNSASA